MSEEAPVNFLLVDDVPQNLEALEALLAHEGLRLFKAHSGAQALELMLEHDFALALLDVQDMNGAYDRASVATAVERVKRVASFWPGGATNDGTAQANPTARSFAASGSAAEEGDIFTRAAKAAPGKAAASGTALGSHHSRRKALGPKCR